MSKHPVFHWFASAMVLTTLVLTACQPIQPLPASAPPASSTDTTIQNAMSAAPPALAKDATVLGWPAAAGGEMTELRQGTNGWTCFPDDPGFPTNDPMCLDAMWMEWFRAYSTQTEPHYTAVGIGYMLQGGTAASNIDPFALEPAAGDVWHVEPPHIMLIFPHDLDPAAYSSDYQSGQPWVMFDDTPYEHLMVPVTEMSH